MIGQVLNKLKRSLWQGNGPSYERLGRLEDGFEKEHTGAERPSRHLKPVIIIFTLLLAIYLFVLPGHDSAATIPSKETLSPAYLRLVLPVRQPDVNLCKTLLSGAILSYPEPVLVGFEGKQEQEASDSDGNLDLAERISRKSSVLNIDNHLRNISAARDEDIVIIADGLSTWFQLRPQTLLDRYFESNRRADERIKRDLGKAAVNLKIRQTILFASSRDCSPWNQEDPACSAVPESTLPADIYGSKTDLDAEDGQDPFSKHRPRYLNPGFAIGPLAAMRALYAEAAKRSLADYPRLQSAEAVLGQIYGEQEAARNTHRLKSMNPIQRMFAWASSFWESASTIAAKQAQELREADLSKEFGIGLDYENGLSFETTHSVDDVAWLRFSDTAQLQAANAAHGIKDSHISNLQTDIATSLPPFWTFGEEPLPRSLGWENVSLLTNVWTGVTPAVIQHDRHHYFEGSLRETWWPNVWFQKYGRKLFDVHIQSPIGALAVSGYDAQTRRQWWSPEDWKGGARNTTKFWWRYEDICTGTEKEVFRDKKGPWYLPANH